ncbi:hypothetical protein [Arthrobacter methylotrophus]|uniref:Lipoprotein n=2 Tax=Arthrobacter methylotrophus TaxID=121291 RepID=A0ABV5UX27_9MICC
MKKLVALAIGAGLALSACGSASAQPPAATPSSPTPSPVQTATPAQFASILSENQKVWRDYNTNIVECGIARVLGKSTADQIKVMTCGMTVVTVTLTAKNAIRDIVALPKPSPEVKKLVDRAITDLTPLSTIDAAVACKDASSEACDEKETLANGQIRDVVSMLDAWAPYMR